MSHRIGNEYSTDKIRPNALLYFNIDLGMVGGASYLTRVQPHLGREWGYYDDGGGNIIIQ